MEVGGNYSMLPLHCTLVHWFRTGAEQKLVEQLSRIIYRFPPQGLLVGEEAIFTGHTKNGSIPVAVNKVARTPSLERLHGRVCDLLDSLSAEYSAPQYVKDGFNPHVTHQSGVGLRPNSTHTSRAVYVVGADAPEYGNARHVVAKFDLGM